MNGKDKQRSPADQQRLEQVFESARKHSENVNSKAVQASIDIATKQSEFIQKIALGCGAAIALVVSFVGGHTGKLHPEWLLRSSLVTLLLAMVCGLFRNWMSQFYLLASWMKQDLTAKLDKERAKSDLICGGHAISAEDGKPIDAPTWRECFIELETKLTSNIAKAARKSDSSLAWMIRAEYATVILASLGMVELVALAWLNF